MARNTVPKRQIKDNERLRGGSYHPNDRIKKKDEVDDMKYADMNERQRKAFRNIVHATDWHIGGLENTVSDNEGTEVAEVAQAQLNDHDGLVEEIYRMATTEVYEEGSCYFGANAEKMLKDIRFCGKEWLMERIERRVAKMGY